MTNVFDDLEQQHHVEGMASQAPPRIVNLTHRDSGRVLTVRVTQDLLVEPVAGFDANFPWAEHQAAVEAAVLAGDYAAFELGFVG